MKDPADYDVYSFGVVSSSTLYRVEGEFPAAQGYAEIKDVQAMVGGEATNSSIVLSRLGASVRLDGNWIGDDEGGTRTKALLADYGIDTSRLPLKKGHRGVEEVVFAAGATRTIFGTYVNLQQTRGWNMPSEDGIRQAKAVCMDPFFAEASLRCAQVASEAGIPAITVDCLLDSPLLELVSAVVVAESFINENYPDHTPDDLFREYQSVSRGLVVFTFGDEPTWYARPGEPVRKCPAYSVTPVDTTGAGDSFRAGVVFGFLKGWQDDEIVRFAAAVAARVCESAPGVLNSPDYDDVIDFMRQRGDIPLPAY